jgi:hypothetical protein
MSKKAGLPNDMVIPVPDLREHLRQVADSAAFEGSRRSKQFLEHVVEKALAGHGAELKERSLGVELFGRDPSYDTGDDAIVRVTATDVRRRLRQFYSANDSDIRIELPVGSYVPAFRRIPGRELGRPPQIVQDHRAAGGRWGRSSLLVISLSALVILALLSWARQQGSHQFSPRDLLPWSVLLKDHRPIHLVLADPDLPAMETLTGKPISLSDYANRRYVNQPESYTKDMQRAFTLLRGVNVAVVDLGIAMEVSRIAVAGSTPLQTHPARTLQLSAFKTDDHFIILGSPRSNPWGTLLQDQLDFDIVHDPKSTGEIIRNKRPRAGELPLYVPSARGWETGHAYAIIALVSNPNQSGKVLLLAGTTAEGTEGAGQFVANHTEFARTLQARGINPADPACDFEMLLQVNTMAGSTAKIQVVACHRLAGRAN